MIYLDNASTSYPKPQEVVNGVNDLICNSAGSSMRTANTEKVDIIFKTRELVARVLNVKYSTSIVFTANATESLNSIIDGFLSKGDNVVATAIEHNSVIRPLIRLKHERGINIRWVKSNEVGYVNPDEVLDQVNEDTEGQGYLFQINRPIPRQYLRTLTAQAIGKPELADWHKYPELNKLWAGKKKLLRAVQGGENN